MTIIRNYYGVENFSGSTSIVSKKKLSETDRILKVSVQRSLCLTAGAETESGIYIEEEEEDLY